MKSISDDMKDNTSDELRDITFSISFTQRQIDEMRSGKEIVLTPNDELLAKLDQKLNEAERRGRIEELEKIKSISRPPEFDSPAHTSRINAVTAWCKDRLNILQSTQNGGSENE